MAVLTIRNIDDTVVKRLRIKAKESGSKTLEPYLREILESHSQESSQSFADEIEGLQQMVFNQHGVLPDSTPLIREDRDKRG